MTLHPCLEAGCPVLTSRRRCHTHERETDKARGTRQQRGYTDVHDALRAWWAQAVQAGNVTCSRCGVLIAPDAAWHLDHSDDRLSYRGPSCTLCNLSAAGRAAHG